MKKNGFTLIELAAVIMILGIIMLIAVPIVLNTIENSKKGAAERSAESYLHTVETTVAWEKTGREIKDGEYTIQEDGSLCLNNECTDENKIVITMSGNKPNSGTIKIANGLVTTESTMSFADNYTVSYDANKGSYVASKEESGGNTTTTVYRWSTDSKSINDTLDPADYTTDPTTLGKDYFLKHELDADNKIIASYACVKYGDDDIACVRGGSTDYYGFAADLANYTGNALILKGLENEGFSCNFSADSSDCFDGSVGLIARSYGHVIANVGYDNCDVYGGGSSYCEISEWD